MKSLAASFMTLVVTFIFIIFTPISKALGDHPRLIFGPHELSALREKVKHEPWSRMYQKLQDDLWKDGQARNQIDWTASNSDLVWPGTRAAFLHVLTGEDSYAEIAREAARRIMDDPVWGQSSTKGLTLYNYAYRVALMYDWCYNSPAWDVTFKEEVSLKLLQMADLIVDNGGTEQNKSPASNWQGIRGSAAAWTFLAIDHQYSSSRFEKAWNLVANYLQENLGTSSEGRGWNIEGLGYTFYPMGDFIGAYGYAQWRNDPTRDLRTVTPAAPWQFWTIYATTMNMPGQVVPVRPDWGDDHAASIFSGTLGTSFWWMPEEMHPAMLYLYDMLVGPEGDSTWDSSRAGTIWSILFHPGWDITQVEPELLPVWNDGYVETGGNGYITWRNGTDNMEDIVAQVYAKLRGNKGHSGPDGLGFRIIGLDNPWAIGGGRYGPKLNGQDAYYQSMNSLYPVEPGSKLTISGDSGSFVGDPVVALDGSGHAVMQVARSNLDVKDWIRRFATDYSKRSGAEAVFVISDSSTNGTYWQMVTHEDNTITTKDNTFTIDGANGNRMEGTVLYPPNVNFATGTRIRGSNYNSAAEVVSYNNDFVYFGSEDGEYLVVLTILRDNALSPSIEATGFWPGPSPNGTVKIGPLELEINNTQLSWKEIHILSDSELAIPEGENAILNITLSAPPSTSVTISPLLLPEAGAYSAFSIDADAPSIVFDAQNWNVPQPVTVKSIIDTNGINEVAHVRFYSDSEAALRPSDVSLSQLDSGPYPFTVFAEEGGVVMGVPQSLTVARNAEVVLTAIPDPGFEFVRWSDDASNDSPTRKIIAQSAVNLEAVFEFSGRLSVEANADAFVRDGTYADTNYGSNNSLVVKHQPTAVGYNRQPFLRFPLPEDLSEISKASLLLTVNGLADPKSKNQLFSIADDSWDESSVTWNNKPQSGDLITTWIPDSLGSIYEIDITAVVEAAQAANKTEINFAILSDGMTYAGYASREEANPVMRPRLQVLAKDVPPSFDEWMMMKWPFVSAEWRMPSSDANHNGIPNIMEYIVGNSSGFPRLVSDASGLKVEWHKRKSTFDVRCTLQWAVHPAGPWHILPESATTAFSQSCDFNVLHTTLPKNESPDGLFFRLQTNLR